MRILVADDDPVYRNLLQGLLEESDFAVALAADGVEAWAILQQSNAPQIAILDWMMPGMDGYEVCRKVRDAFCEKGDSTPYILLMTSNSRREDLVRVMVAGADDYLLKPFEPLDLKIRLRIAIRIINLEEQLRLRSLT